MKIKNICTFSKDRKYRYLLFNIWDSKKPFCMFVGCNPSKADEIRSDPTVTRCINYAKKWGYGGLCMSNIFSYRETNPELMKKQKDPIGPDNDFHLIESSKEAGIIIAAWGKHGSFLNRGQEVINLIPNLYCLAKNKDGSPKHPLYLKKDLIPVKYN